MRQILSVLVVFSLLGNEVRSIRLKGLSKSLSRIADNFGRAAGNLDPLETIASFSGYSSVSIEGYWQANTLAGFTQVKRGDVEEAMDTFNMAIATLTVWDLGQGIALPIADKLVNKIILKYQDDFRKTISAFNNYKNVMKTDVLEAATAAATPDALKTRLLDAKSQISTAFQSDVTTGMSKFKNTQIYADLVTDLKGVKSWAKALKYADVFAGPLFDAATVAVSAWQLAEAIKGKDPFGIASNALGLASGIVGITSFAVAALATAGTTLAAVAGPVGAIIGAVLCVASVIIDVISSLNPYKQIDRDISLLEELTENSKKLLDFDKEKLNQFVPSHAKFKFSWVYEMNQGLALEYVRGRASEYYVPVKFRLERPPKKDEDGYITIGENKDFDKSKYPKNLFWNPRGVVKIGHDFYGKALTDDFNGATIIADTGLVAGKPDVELKGLDIVTYQKPEDEFRDAVIIEDMYDIAFQNNIKVKTGGGNDIIMMNGQIGKPGHKDYHEGYGQKIDIKTAMDEHADTTKKEFNILSFEGMPKTKKHDYQVHGIKYDMLSGRVSYRIGSASEPSDKFWGHVTGVRMFVGSPFDDIVYLHMNHDITVRETKGRNEYILHTTNWGPFSITIDDQSSTPGKITIINYHTFAGIVSSSHLVYSDDTKTLFIYGRQRGERWRIRGRIFFNRRTEGYHVIRTDSDGIEKPLNEFPLSFTPEGESDYLFNPEKGVQYHFDRNLESSACSAYKIYLNPPEFQSGRFTMTFRKRKNTKDFLIMKQEFVTKCLKRAKRNMAVIRTGRTFDNHWIVKLKAENNEDNPACPGKDFEVEIGNLPFERLMEERDNGELRLVVDFCRDKRFLIDVNREMQKLDDRQSFSFNKDIQGTFGIPQVVELKRPEDEKPASTVKHFIDLKGGRKLNEDSLVFTEDLRDWAKTGSRTITLKRKNANFWRLNIADADGKISHQVDLRNIEWVDYEPSDKEYRLPIVPDLSSETADTINMEERTERKIMFNKETYSERTNDCSREEKANSK